MIVPITEADDPRIEPYAQVRERDLVGRLGRFIAEGEVVLGHLASSPLVRPISLLIAEQRLGAIQGVIDRLPEDLPVYVAAQGVLDRIAGFHLHRGLLGLGERRAAPSAAEVIGAVGEGGLVVVLFGIGNHDNMGGLFRNAAAFGADAVLLDATCCDPLYRKAIRVSVGAALRVPFARFDASDDPVAMLTAAGFTPLALSPTGAEPLSRLARPGKAAVLLGSEGPGLPATVMARCQTVSIPMAAGFDSLNVATTCGIVLHQLTQARQT
jgi:tRNA G18 (ribose-2'-O)-methylase SpoU